MTKKIPPFYKNPDNSHCFQCTLKGIIDFYEPERLPEWQDVLNFTERNSKLMVWPERSYVKLLNSDYQVKRFSTFDFERFINAGSIYLEERFGTEDAAKQSKLSDIPTETQHTKAFVKHPNTQIIAAAATQTDIEKLLHEDYLILAHVNIFGLRDMPGFSNHIVLVHSCDNNGVTMHDSGSHPDIKSAENLHVPWPIFMAAMRLPNGNPLALVGIKKI